MKGRGGGVVFLLSAVKNVKKKSKISPIIFCVCVFDSIHLAFLGWVGLGWVLYTQLTERDSGE